MSYSSFFKSYKLFYLILVILTFYFIYHAFQGSRGLIAHFSAKERIDTLERDLSALQKQSTRLKNKITKLGSGNHTIDTDLLEKYLREFGYIQDGEIIFMEEKAK